MQGHYLIVKAWESKSRYNTFHKGHSDLRCPLSLSRVGFTPFHKGVYHYQEVFIDFARWHVSKIYLPTFSWLVSFPLDWVEQRGWFYGPLWVNLRTNRTGL